MHRGPRFGDSSAPGPYASLAGHIDAAGNFDRATGVRSWKEAPTSIKLHLSQSRAVVRTRVLAVAAAADHYYDACPTKAAIKRKASCSVVTS